MNASNTGSKFASKFKPKYLVIHCKHAGCFDFNFIEHRPSRTRFIPITINCPKVFMFDNKDEAREFFNEYMTDLDCPDVRCKITTTNSTHVDFCLCGVVDVDEEDQPNLFYNRTNQLFLLEHMADTFVVPQNSRMNINNLNVTQNFMKRYKYMSEEQRNKYIELGQLCEDCNIDSFLETKEREMEEQRLKAEKEKRDREKKMLQDEKRRQQETEQWTETIFSELQNQLQGERRALALLNELRRETVTQMQQQFEHQIETMVHDFNNPVVNINSTIEQPRNVVVSDLGRPAYYPSPPPYKPDDKYVAKPRQYEDDDDDDDDVDNIIIGETNDTSSSSVPLCQPVTTEEPKKRKYNKKPKA